MNSETAIHSFRFLRIGTVSVSLHGITSDSANIAMAFSSERATGLSASFHGSTDEMRQLAAELIRHADITDAAQALRDAGKAA